MLPADVTIRRWIWQSSGSVSPSRPHEPKPLARRGHPRDGSHCGVGPPDTRVLRGGAFNNNQHNARCAYRNNNHPDNRNDNIGFRVVVSHDSHTSPEMRLSFRTEPPRRRLRAGPALALAVLHFQQCKRANTEQARASFFSEPSASRPLLVTHYSSRTTHPVLTPTLSSSSPMTNFPSLVYVQIHRAA